MTAIGVLLDYFLLDLLGGFKLSLLRSPLLVVHAFAGVSRNVPMLESSGQRLIQRIEIVHRTFSVGTTYGKASVFGFPGHAVFEHHHGCHLERPAHRIRDVIAFDAQRRLAESKRIGHIVHGGRTRTYVGDAAHFRTLQRLLCVLFGAFEQLPLVTPCRRPNRDRATAKPSQVLFQVIGTRRHHRHQHLSGHRGDRFEQIGTTSMLASCVTCLGRLCAG